MSFEEAVQKITGFAAEEKGYVATSSSEKQANGKLSGEVVVKVLPDNLDRFLQKLRGIGELKNQALTTEDVTKAYFDTESRLKNARSMEQRLIEILKTKSNDVADLLEVEKELGRVREEIETMQGELKFMDSQVKFATVTIQLSEKNMNIPAAFLLKERAQLALYAPEVEKTYNEIKALASPKVQITNAQINRDNTGRVSGYVYMLIAPEESDAIISRVKAMARVENFQVQTERIAQGGDGLGEDAKTERDKVVLNVTISREEQEQALQQTSLRIRSTDVNERTKQLRELAEKQSGRVRSSSFSRDPNGRESANVSLRVPMKNYSALMQSLNALGKVENVSIHRNDRPDAQVNQADAPADIRSGLQPGQHRLRGDGRDRDAAPHDRTGRRGTDVERANDRCGGRVSRAMGAGDCRPWLGAAACFTRAPRSEAARGRAGRIELTAMQSCAGWNCLSSRAAQTARDLATAMLVSLRPRNLTSNI